MSDALTTTGAFFAVMSLIVTAPYLLWRVARTDDYVPLVIVQIAAGILLGPAVAGRLLPEIHTALFTAPVMQWLSGIATWAVAIFVWLAGLELDVRQAWAHRRECLITAGLALGVPLVLGVLTGFLLASNPRWIGDHASPWQFVAAIGMACAVTALPVLILLLDKLSTLGAPIAQRVLRYASLDDIAIWIVLAAILMDLQRLGLQLTFVAGFAACSPGYRRLMPRLDPADRWFTGIIWLVLSSWAAEAGGLHFMIGAFLAGAVTDPEWFDERRRGEMRNAVLVLLMPVYFLVAGLRTDWGIDSATVLAVAGALLAAAIAGKLLGVQLAGRILGWPTGEARLIGWILQTKGLILIVFTGVLLDKRLISRETFTALLIMGLASTILTVPMSRPKLAGIAR
jgi:Kef-type K+ transport system membrane component KefB